MPRFGLLKNQDNTGRVLNFGKLTPAYASSITIAPSASKTFVIPADLTGALSLVADVSNAVDCDELVCVFKASGANRVVTFSTGFATAGTLTVLSGKSGSATFVFNGTAFVEKSRALEA